MCGFAGCINLRNNPKVELATLRRMTETLVHRGPDSCGYFVADDVGLGFRRLSIIDPAGGDQPIYNEDESIVLVCNGEIYNYRELRNSLIHKGHSFRTNSDVEVILHLYEEDGDAFLNKLNGQFAFALYDIKKKRLLLARDHFGVNPLHFTIVDDTLIFASEIKAILQHPLVRREVDLTGLDQIFSFPGLISPRTMFKGVESLKSGHSISVQGSNVRVAEYWDLDYPRLGELADGQPEEKYVEQLKEHFTQSVSYRLQADVPVGFYLSGGLDSSMIAAMIRQAAPQADRHSFSITFGDAAMCESRAQQTMVTHVNSLHHDIRFGWSEIAERLRSMIYHCECPVKETYNTCSMALSEAARSSGVPVVLTGEGADEMFAGYVGYRFDQLGLRNSQSRDLDTVMEEELREQLWGNRDLFYEIDQYSFRETKNALYSDGVNELFDDFECLNFEIVNKERLRDRHFVHQRSYLDFKLRLSDHLISDHGDRMALANSVEARYPFLDVDLVEFAKTIPPELKLNDFTEKYILKRVAEGLVPKEIIEREKFGFYAPGSPYLLKQNIPWIDDLLSPERIKRQGYFNPATIERLRRQYTQPNFKLNLPFESDLLMIVLSFGVFLEVFDLPDFN